MKEHDFAKMSQEEFIKAAFTEAMNREIAELEAMDIEVLEPTEEQRREIKELLDSKFGGKNNLHP